MYFKHYSSVAVSAVLMMPALVCSDNNSLPPDEPIGVAKYVCPQYGYTECVWWDLKNQLVLIVV